MNQNKFNTGRIRRLVGDERKFLWNPLSNVTIVTRIKGYVSSDKLRKAINKMKERHPLLSTRVVYDKDNIAWFHNDNIPEIPLRIVNRESDNQWQNELMYENRIPFNIFSGPLIRFVLVKSSQVSDFMVFCQHSICDGRALVYLIRDILTHTADPDMEIKPLSLPPMLSPEDLSSYIPKKSIGRSIKNYMINRMNDKWRNDMVTFDQEDFENIHKVYWQWHKYRIEFMELSEDQTSNLVSKCRKHNVTVNSALSAAFLGAHYDICGSFKGKKRNVALPVDLRNHMDEPVGDVLCLYINRVMFSFDYSPKEDFWQNVKRFHNTVKKEIESTNLFESFFTLESLEPTILDALASFGTLAGTVPKGFSRYEKLSSFANKKKNIAIKLSKRFLRLSPGLIMTNLGKLDIPDVYGDMQIDKMFFAPSTDKRFPLVLGALTVAGKLILTINYVEESRTDNMIKIRDRAVHYLEE